MKHNSAGRKLRAKFFACCSQAYTFTKQLNRDTFSKGHISLLLDFSKKQRDTGIKREGTANAVPSRKNSLFIGV